MYYDVLAKQLCARRAESGAVKDDLAGLLKAIFAREADSSWLDSPELAQEVEGVLSQLEDICRYCAEERYLHGKSLEELTLEFRASMDIAEFVDMLLEDIPNALSQLACEKMESTVFAMTRNGFRELNDPKAGDSGADRTVADIVRGAAERLNSYHYRYGDIFKMYFLEGRSREEIARWAEADLEGFVNNTCAAALRLMRNPARSRGLEKFLVDDGSAVYKCGRCGVRIKTKETPPLECPLCKKEGYSEQLSPYEWL